MWILSENTDDFMIGNMVRKANGISLFADRTKKRALTSLLTTGRQAVSRGSLVVRVGTLKETNLTGQAQRALFPE